MVYEDYDVVIGGAGPAGLLLGKELSKGNRVLILERGRVGETDKNWMTFGDRWAREGFPKEFIENTFNEWHMQLRYGEDLRNEYVIKDNFICFNEHKFIKYLAALLQRK